MPDRLVGPTFGPRHSRTQSAPRDGSLGLLHYATRRPSDPLGDIESESLVLTTETQKLTPP